MIYKIEVCLIGPGLSRPATHIESDLWNTLQKTKEAALSIAKKYDLLYIDGLTVEEAIQKEFERILS